MPGELASTSLLEHVAESGFRASIFTTYSCYFPFYEEVVLRRLISAGCTHNVLMVDATRCAEAFSVDELRPRRAGRDYTLIPVNVGGGVFHPKLFLRLGKSKGSLLVGSHNVTLSGFGLNDEITNVIRLEGTALKGGGATFRQALDYLARFVPRQLKEVVEAFEGVKLGVPWLDGPLGTGTKDRQLLTVSATGIDLWSQVVPLIPRGVTTAFVGGPFFDSKLAMIRRLQREVQPKRLVIGIDPATVEIEPKEAAKLKDVEWVNIGGVPQIPHRREGTAPYLHAKLCWFASKEGELLVTGSANPTASAFSADAERRNAEAVVADRSIGAASKLGIDALLAAPAVTSTDWTAVVARLKSTHPTDEVHRRILVATPTSTGFLTHEALETGLVLHGLGDEDDLLGEAVAREAGVIESSEVVRDQARYLETRGAKVHTVVIVHRGEDIAKNLGGDTSKALRHALGALEEDPMQLETLLKLTEKVIFDSDDVVRSTPTRLHAPAVAAQEAAAAPASLALEAAGRRSSARRTRSLASGDILVLLDALTRRLGEGLPASGPPRPRSEEEQIGADEEEGGDLSREDPGTEVLAKACRGKVRRLIKRMQGQFELAKSPDRARRGIVQLAAVLGVMRTLRFVEQRPEWKRKGHTLVDTDDKWNLLRSGVFAVAWGAETLAPRAVAEADGEGFAELSMVVGLLAWLAWEIETDITVASHRSGLEGVEEQHWDAVQLLATLGPWLIDDSSAVGVLEESVMRTPRPGVDGDRWLRMHLAALDEFALVCTAPDGAGTTGRQVRPGDLVILPASEDPRVRVALEVREGKVVILAPEEEDGERTFVSSRVATCPWDVGAAIAGAAG